MVFEATVVVDFGDGTDGFYIVELDDTRNLDSSGNTKSSFNPGDVVYFYVHTEPKYKVSKITKSSGSVTELGTYSYDTTDRLQWEELNTESELTYIPSSITSTEYYGNQPVIERSVRAMTNTSDFPAIGDINYKYNAILFKYTPPSIVLIDDEDDYPVLVVIYLEE